MKRKLIAASFAFATLMAMSTSASAMCLWNCPAPVVAPSPNMDLTVGAASQSGGLAGSEALGNLTLTMASENGMATNSASLNALGGLGGAPTASGGWMANAFATHTAATSGHALSAGFGSSAALVQGSTSGNASANVMVLKALP